MAEQEAAEITTAGSESSDEEIKAKSKRGKKRFKPKGAEGAAPRKKNKATKEADNASFAFGVSTLVVGRLKENVAKTNKTDPTFAD